MKYLLAFAIAAAYGLASPSAGMAQDVRIQTGPQGLRIGTPHQFSNYGSDSYGRRLNRYQNNYGYHNNGYYNDGHHNYGYRNDGYRQSGQYGYQNHDYYGGNYGRVRDYRGYYRSNPYSGYNNGYYSRPGFSIGGGSSRVYFGF